MLTKHNVYITKLQKKNKPPNRYLFLFVYFFAYTYFICYIVLIDSDTFSLSTSASDERILSILFFYLPTTCLHP